MKIAHWSKVAKSLAAKYQLSWSDAKTAYRNLKTTAPRKPSLRMVSELPASLPRNLKGAKTKQTKSEKSAKVENTKTTVFPLPPKFVLAPKAEKPTAAPIPTRQGARNKFEKLLKAANLPVSAIARTDTGKLIAAQWRNEKLQQQLVKLMAQGYKQISKNGAMKEQTIFRVEKTMQKMGIAPNSLMWNNTLKQLYGQKTGK